LLVCQPVYRLLYGYEAMNCCDANGQCIQGKDCPARATNTSCNEIDETIDPSERITVYDWIMDAIHTAVSAILGAALIGAVFYLSWKP
jgi:hypothetical protein